LNESSVEPGLSGEQTDIAAPKPEDLTTFGSSEIVGELSCTLYDPEDPSNGIDLSPAELMGPSLSMAWDRRGRVRIEEE
jgi:hypothetical protein